MGVRAVERQLRKRIVKQYPPQRCRATSKQTGKQCEQWAMVASPTCQMHGSAAKQVREAVQTRVLLADAMAHGARRSPRAILADAGHLSDHLMRQAISAIDQIDEPVSVDLVDQLTAAIGRAQHIAKINVDLDIDESTLSAENTAALTFALSVALPALGLDISEVRVGRALSAAMRSFDSLGLKATDRRRAIDNAIAKIKGDMAAKAAQQESEIAARIEAAKAQQLAGLRHAAQRGRCPCCDTMPSQRQAQRALPRGVLTAIADAIDPGPPEPERPVHSPQSPSESDVIVGEIVIDPPRALPRWPVCEFCHRLRDPSHERGGCGAFR